MSGDEGHVSSARHPDDAPGPAETFDARVARLVLATDGVRAPSALASRVLAAVSARSATLANERRWDTAWRSARRGALMALVAAVLSALFAFWDDRHLASVVANSGEDRIGIGGDP